MKSFLCILSVFLILCIGSCSGWLCWKCDAYDSYSGATCSDPFFANDPDLLKEECEGTCLKQVITDPNVPYKRYSRRCDITREKCKSGCSTSSGGVKTCEECCRKKNLCNGAGSVTFSIVLMTGAALLARLL